jgi:hypothetical protein
MNNVLRMVKEHLSTGKQTESGWTAEEGDRVEITLPAYHAATGTVIHTGEVFGFGNSCVVRVDDSTEVVKLPCCSVKVISHLVLPSAGAVNPGDKKSVKKAASGTPIHSQPE